MIIPNVIPRNGAPANTTICDALDKVLEALNGVDLSALNPTQVYIVMLGIRDGVERALPAQEGLYEVHQKSLKQ